MPAPVLDRLHAEVTRIVTGPLLAPRLEQLGSVPIPRERAAFRALSVSETERWGRVVLASGARPE